ncbi:hypothetical protein DERP_008913 [Dermatophagoides pteronyssinus]|uniref:Secreted protein n=1 Tax=Dermatophagoides pteronyssinus TaxID=6956 RepID=A0ABQ8JNM7_DERPT|nr:hypothetical protein DERP_008913 [Dermatophagoides pteronyssinus]
MFYRNRFLLDCRLMTTNYYIVYRICDSMISKIRLWIYDVCCALALVTCVNANERLSRSPNEPALNNLARSASVDREGSVVYCLMELIIQNT